MNMIEITLHILIRCSLSCLVFLFVLDKYYPPILLYMTSSNSYAKTYANRRSATEVELYKLILFPADNSIAVVKSKQCSPAEHDGFLHVQSGRKKFPGVVLEEGKVEIRPKKEQNEKEHVEHLFFLMLDWRIRQWFDLVKKERIKIIHDSSIFDIAFECLFASNESMTDQWSYFSIFSLIGVAT